MTSLTAAQIEKLNRDPITDPYLLLVEIEELNTGTVHRYVNNNEDITSTVSDGSTSETWTAATIAFSLPGSGEEIRDVSLTVSNIDRAAGRALILSSDMIMVRLIVIDYASPNAALIDTYDLMHIGTGDVDAETVEVKLISSIDFNLPWPPGRMTEQLFPGVYA